MDFKELAARIDVCLLVHQERFRRRLHRIRQTHNVTQFAKLARAIDHSARNRSRRQATLPRPEYPLALPVLDKKETIKKAIAEHPVVIVAGETGSGKSTQLPKFCLELGRGVGGYIGHTQPRRLAARSICTRLAEELHSEVGGAVGFKVRFADAVGENTFIKLMTDGILLAEISHDPKLMAYDTIIIDEAHERSVNIDFLLGYLKQLLPERPDLKIIVTSATIDTERFSKFFNDAPVLEVSGRSYPVEIRYRPPEFFDEEDPDFFNAVCSAVEELVKEPQGDILVFLTGEGEIKETMEGLHKRFGRQWEVLPLYARLSVADQQRIFAPGAARRIILSTNVAETSLTVPRIRYVIDSGLARVSRYSTRSKVQRLPIEKIAQANANQRAGRCGRLSAGICLRLYSQEDFLNRPAFTPPEITRSNLAGVILQMKALHIGDIEAFDFIEAPDNRQIKAGISQLKELQALGEDGQLTETGRLLARLPVDPQIGRMLLEARDLHCLNEVLIVGSGLAAQDIRERPLEYKQAADLKHKVYQDKDSDFLTLLKLWRALEEKRRQLSVRKFKQFCHDEFLSYRRFGEWQSLHKQLHKLCVDMNWRRNETPARSEEIHRSLLTGLLANVAYKSDKHEYTGARGLKLHIFPGSGLFKAAPPWIMSGEMVETSRLYAHTVARVEPEWVERCAQHLIKKHYFEPHWEKRGGYVVAFEQVSLYGMVLVAKRKVNFGPIDAVVARRLFIQHALVEQDYHCDGAFFRHNKQCVEDVARLEAKIRRHDFLADDKVLFDFYDERLPHDIHDGKAFEAWRNRVEHESPKLLFMEMELLLRKKADAQVVQQYPDFMPLPQGGRLKLDYYFEPGHVRDGVTVTVPRHMLHRLSSTFFDGLVPGLLKEKLEWMLRALPKAQRRLFVPIPETVKQWMEELPWPMADLQQAFAQRLRKRVGDFEAPDAETLNLPAHLRMNFKVVDDQGAYLDMGRDLGALQQSIGQIHESPDTALPWPQAREDVRAQDWRLAVSVTMQLRGTEHVGYPALRARGEKIALEVHETEEAAAESTQRGLVALLRWRLKEQLLDVRKRVLQDRALLLLTQSVEKSSGFIEDVEEALLKRLFLNQTPRDAQAFEESVMTHKARLHGETTELLALLKSCLTDLHSIRRSIKNVSPAKLKIFADVQDQMHRMFYSGFVAATPAQWLSEYPRYTQAVCRRLQKAQDQIGRDEAQGRLLQSLWQGFWQAVGDKPLAQWPSAWVDFRFELEELRVSLFAQELKTRVPVSVQRLEKKWREIR